MPYYMMQTVPDEEDTVSVLKNPMLRKDSRVCTNSTLVPPKEGAVVCFKQDSSFYPVEECTVAPP